MHAVMSLASYLCALAATAAFWMGVSDDSLLLRAAGAVAATVGIWMAESVERRARSTSQAATLNGVLLLAMAGISLYLHFTG